MIKVMTAREKANQRRAKRARMDRQLGIARSGNRTIVPRNFNFDNPRLGAGSAFRTGTLQDMGSGIVRVGTRGPKRIVDNQMKTVGPKVMQMQAPKERPRAAAVRQKRDDGVGEAMSFAQKSKFIKSKNKDYKIKKFGTGGVYGVRRTV
jgi:hypothetical protein